MCVQHPPILKICLSQLLHIKIYRNLICLGNQITAAQIAFASKGEDIKTLYPNRTEREYIALSLCLKNGKVKRKDLERALGKSRPTCNNTIKVLREDGLLDQRESGPATYYTLRRV